MEQAAQEASFKIWAVDDVVYGPVDSATLTEWVRDERVLDRIRTVPRHLFVDEALATRAYEDTSLPIGYGQTISQPYIVGLMTDLLKLTPTSRVLSEPSLMRVRLR